MLTSFLKGPGLICLGLLCGGKEVEVMAAQLTDLQKKKIVADYLETENLSETARRNNVVPSTVQRLVRDCEDFENLAKQKKEQNDADILAYMESKRSKVCEIIGIYLDALPELDNFKNLSPTQLTIAIGTLIDKWSLINGAGLGGPAVQDPLSASLEEMAKELTGDDQ